MPRGRLNLATKLQRILSREYHRPIMQVIDDYLAEGLSVREVAERIEGETGMHVSHNTLYNWLLAREGERQGQEVPA